MAVKTDCERVVKMAGTKEYLTEMRMAAARANYSDAKKVGRMVLLKDMKKAE